MALFLKALVVIQPMNSGQSQEKPPDDMPTDTGSPLKFGLMSAPPLPSGTDTAELRTAKEMILHQIMPNRLPPIGESPAYMSHICPDKPSDTVRNPLRKISQFDLSPNFSDSSDTSSDVSISVSSSNSQTTQHQSISKTSHHSTVGQSVSEHQSYSEYANPTEKSHHSYSESHHPTISHSNAPTQDISRTSTRRTSIYNSGSEESTYYQSTSEYEYESSSTDKRKMRRISNTQTEYTSLSETGTHTESNSVSVNSNPSTFSKKSRSLPQAATPNPPQKSRCCYIA